jgi:hypothetical protein
MQWLPLLISFIALIASIISFTVTDENLSSLFGILGFILSAAVIIKIVFFA